MLAEDTYKVLLLFPNKPTIQPRWLDRVNANLIHNENVLWPNHIFSVLRLFIFIYI